CGLTYNGFAQPGLQSPQNPGGCGTIGTYTIVGQLTPGTYAGVWNLDVDPQSTSSDLVNPQAEGSQFTSPLTINLRIMNGGSLGGSAVSRTYTVFTISGSAPWTFATPTINIYQNDSGACTATTTVAGASVTAQTLS